MIKDAVKSIKKITFDSALVVSSDFYRKGVPFLLLPVLTYYLTPDEYGMISYIVSIALITQPHTFISSQWNFLI